ncbi:MAG TPA: dienelactone hydrolase family protein [Methylomirabilota bacterium]|jgi:phospholipase/carboxylesterase|nr:dienelactone hydrolase family protein [Methylomirabilota bacterium]
MADDLLESLELETAPSPGAAVIWMHGLGADGYDFADVPPMLGLPRSLAVRFVFPHAPMMPVTINGGMVMRAWYDVLMAGGARQGDEQGLRGSQKKVEALIARETSRGIPAARLVLAGFSQGGAMTFQTGLRHPERLAGLMALSCYLPLADTVASEAHPANRDVPIFFAHGTDDASIPIERARRGREALTALGYGIEWHEYPMPHSVCDAELRDIGAWLTRILA